MKSVIILACTSLLLFAGGCEDETPAEPGTQKQYVVYDFGAEWCGPCKSYAPTFEGFQKNYTRSNVTFKRVNVDEDQKTASRFRISALPTVVVTADEKEVARFEGGCRSEKQLLKALK
jgi:thioredoxin 1